jgi:signal transduction histidine kinase
MPSQARSKPLKITTAPERLTQQYAEALERYLRTADEAELRKADELGRQAAQAGAEVVEIATIHHRTMMQVLIRALRNAQEPKALESAGLFCASCPAWYTGDQEQSDTGKALEKLFVDTLSSLAQTHETLRKSNRALRRINEVREEEARRMARDLHDQAGQMLATVHLSLNELVPEVGDPQKERILNIRSFLGEVEQQIRRLSHELHPAVLDNFGLAASLEFLAEGISKRAGFPIELECTVKERLPVAVETAIYRTAQEALNNAAKHSRASRVRMKLVHGERCAVFTVEDDGIGFERNDPKPGRSHGLGFVGIQERLEGLGGTLSIRTARGKGTALHVTVPITLDGELTPSCSSKN